jgi:trigger factor
MDRVKQQILSDKVYDLLIERFDVQEKTREEFEEEMHQHRQPAQAPQQAAR